VADCGRAQVLRRLYSSRNDLVEVREVPCLQDCSDTAIDILLCILTSFTMLASSQWEVVQTIVKVPIFILKQEQ
jgi:hypothetical protein